MLQPIPDKKISIRSIYSKKDYENKLVLVGKEWIRDRFTLIRMMPEYEELRTYLLGFKEEVSEERVLRGIEFVTGYSERVPDEYTEWDVIGCIEAVLLRNGEEYVAIPLKSFKLFWDRSEELSVYVKDKNSPVLFYNGVLVGVVMPYRNEVLASIVKEVRGE